MGKSPDEQNLILARFKSNQGLSDSDIATIFQIDISLARQWSKGIQVDPKADAAALALNIIMERWKKETGSFNDVDYQHLMHSAHLLEKENADLKAEISAIRNGLKALDDYRGYLKTLNPPPSLEQTERDKSMDAHHLAIDEANKDAPMLTIDTEFEVF